MDMRQLIKVMLQVEPSVRPTCEQILTMPIIRKRVAKYFATADGSLSPMF